MTSQPARDVFVPGVYALAGVQGLFVFGTLLNERASAGMPGGFFLAVPALLLAGLTWQVNNGERVPLWEVIFAVLTTVGQTLLGLIILFVFADWTTVVYGLLSTGVGIALGMFTRRAVRPHKGFSHLAFKKGKDSSAYSHGPVPPSVFRTCANYVVGATMAVLGAVIMGFVELHDGLGGDGLNGGVLTVFGAPSLFGLITVYFTWLIHARRPLGEWLMLMVVPSYLAAVATVLLAFLMPSMLGVGISRGFGLTLAIWAGLLTVACALFVSTLQVHRTLRRHRRITMNVSPL